MAFTFSYGQLYIIAAISTYKVTSSVPWGKDHATTSLVKHAVVHAGPTYGRCVDNGSHLGEVVHQHAVKEGFIII